MTSNPKSSRVTYIDWMRGVACLLMFQIHGYDAWLNPEARATGFFAWARFLGGYAAPAFLFLAGVSLAFAIDKLQSRGETAARIAAVTVRRGAVVLGFGLLLRLQGVVFSLGKTPWDELFKVDVLNIIGLSMMLIGMTSWGVLGMKPRNFRGPLAAVSAVIALALSVLASPLWTTWRPRWLPWPLESYINGVHNLNQPQPWLFPIFPWGAFAFAGMALGLVLTAESARRYPFKTILFAAAGGGVLVLAARYLDTHGPALYADYSFWRTRPNQLLIQLGVLLMFLAPAYSWCRWVLGSRHSSPLILLGRHTMLVYWVHLTLVYGFPVIPRGTASLFRASAGVLGVSAGMYTLVLAWSWWKNHRLQDVAPPFTSDR